MKHLMILAALLVSTAAVAQIPTLPWNPDENGDQFIGLPDLLGLLTVYGQEFENAIVSEDGESAIMYMGDMGFPLCAQACRNLPGIWSIAKLKDLGLVWSDVLSGQRVWLDDSSFENDIPYLYAWNPQAEDIFGTYYANEGYRCYCTAKQLPRVEYSYCEGSANFGELQNCCDEKTADGWYPLSGIAPNEVFEGFQAFWRFAQ